MSPNFSFSKISTICGKPLITLLCQCAHFRRTAVRAHLRATSGPNCAKTLIIYGMVHEYAKLNIRCTVLYICSKWRLSFQQSKCRLSSRRRRGAARRAAQGLSDPENPEYPSEKCAPRAASLLLNRSSDPIGAAPLDDSMRPAGPQRRVLYSTVLYCRCANEP